MHVHELTYLWTVFKGLYRAMRVKGELHDLHGGHSSCIHCGARVIPVIRVETSNIDSWASYKTVGSPPMIARERERERDGAIELCCCKITWRCKLTNCLPHGLT